MAAWEGHNAYAIHNRQSPLRASQLQKVHAGASIVLAGPIVRRVEPRLAAVWVAIDEPCRVTLDIFRDAQIAPTLPAPQFSSGVRAVRAGAKIYVALVVADL